MTILSPALLARIRTIRTTLLNDVQDGFSPCTYVAWTKNRPAGWDTGTDDEGWVQVVSGTGLLRANGNGGPVIGEDVIYQQAPYQFRTDRDDGIAPHMWLVVDGTRLFKVEGVTAEDPEKPIVHAYLTEVVDMTLPGVTP